MPTLYQQLIHPQCPKELLNEHRDSHSMLVARNPNASVETLEYLIEHAKMASVVQAALANPSLLLYSLEKPDKYETLTETGEDNVLRKKLYMVGQRLKGDEFQRLALCYVQRIGHHLKSEPVASDPTMEHPLVLKVYRGIFQYFETDPAKRTAHDREKALWPLFKSLGKIRIFKPTIIEDEEKAAPELVLAVQEERRWFNVATCARHAFRHLLSHKESYHSPYGWKELSSVGYATRRTVQLVNASMKDMADEYRWQVELAESGKFIPREGLSALPTEQLSLL